MREKETRNFLLDSSFVRIFFSLNGFCSKFLALLLLAKLMLTFHSIVWACFFFKTIFFHFDRSVGMYNYRISLFSFIMMVLVSLLMVLVSLFSFQNVYTTLPSVHLWHSWWVLNEQ